ncbi:type ISP restriction/modification enzyme [Mariprofundus erugo]|uniref:type ISP restriction/modification enzyme n=1 Tax=Mariprofundus erugo TaxID=2528639 RepID=UPI001930E70D|nr:type ISP restriction/modification enzyme [Mariprofundus erugo]
MNSVEVTNEPRHISCGNPDYVISKNAIPIGFIEAKVIGKNLNSKDYKEQFDRYKGALENLIITDYLWFQFFKDGELVHEVRIGKVEGERVVPLAENFNDFENRISDFCSYAGRTIAAPTKLAEMMAGKAKLLRDNILKALELDLKSNANSSLTGQFKAFKEMLIHDLDTKQFADIYAQTLTYGLFAARYNDNSLDTFSREEAANLLPSSNPLLQSFFRHVAGYEIDNAIRHTVDSLVEVFKATDVRKLLSNFGGKSDSKDPVIHFYEDFLKLYDKGMKVDRGVWYTPDAVVSFIVRAVDHVLKNEFALADGLADISKIPVNLATGQTNKKGKETSTTQQMHKVQILDPATGTGTFLVETIRQIESSVKSVGEGMWPRYVDNDLIPRLNGFELLMTPYSMCHLKLGMALAESGYVAQNSMPRFNVYLTNSLEKGERITQDLFMAQWLSTEAKQANTIKLDKPIMCIMGNPPYKGLSSNNSAWIKALIDDYKKVDGQDFGERKHWLNDDYVKFIRMSENMIEKNGEGVFAMITNHAFMSNPTFRGMRQHLMATYDKIFLLDLHGNAAGGNANKDQSVFNITLGTSIMIAVKKKLPVGKVKSPADVFHAEIRGKKLAKFEFLNSNDINSVNWKKLEPVSPYYMFYPIDMTTLAQYEFGAKITDLMPVNSVGFVTGHDGLNISFTKEEHAQKMRDLAEMEETAWRRKYQKKGKPAKDSRDWRYGNAKSDAAPYNSSDQLTPVSYRPFDTRWTYYTGHSRGMYASPQRDVMQHLLSNGNIGLVLNRQIRTEHIFHHTVTDLIGDYHILETANANPYFFPLYLKSGNAMVSEERSVNFDPELFKVFQTKATDDIHGVPNELNLFDYIYGVLHCPAYRETYKEFLRIDFPKIPYPSSPDEFWSIEENGEQLRKLHLMDVSVIGQTPYPVMGDGDFIVGNVEYKDGAIWFNDTQCFMNIPELVWNFEIGGYKPAQKWLKDRSGRELTFDEARHYQRIIKVLVETDRIMKSITMELG